MNPWESITLSDYEDHMSLASVSQLQALNEIMRMQIEDCNIDILVILGVAGGNGLEYIKGTKIKTVYGIDINSEYLCAVKSRYHDLGDRLKCLCVDVIENYAQLPQAEYVIADLFLEYVGCHVFAEALEQMQTKYVSCVIQVNGEGNWVSNSPYEKCFECLEKVHHAITENELITEMEIHNYFFKKQMEMALPNGKKLNRIDFYKGW